MEGERIKSLVCADGWSPDLDSVRILSWLATASVGPASQAASSLLSALRARRQCMSGNADFCYAFGPSTAQSTTAESIPFCILFSFYWVRLAYRPLITLDTRHFAIWLVNFASDAHPRLGEGRANTPLTPTLAGCGEGYMAGVGS